MGLEAIVFSSRPRQGFSRLSGAQAVRQHHDGGRRAAGQTDRPAGKDRADTTYAARQMDADLAGRWVAPRQVDLPQVRAYVPKASALELMMWLLNSPAVIRPVQERLALAPSARQVPRLAICPDLRDVALHRLPATDLAGVLLGHPPAQVIAAISLEPAARIVWMYPALSSPFRQGLAGIHTEIVQGAVAAGE